MKIKSIKELLGSLFKGNNVEYFDLLEEYEDVVRGQDLELRNTLVGTVRSREQYELNYKHRFYHIPERFVDNPDDIKYVALYRSKNLFADDEPGIKHFGHVISYMRIKRRDIKELHASAFSDDYYYRFDISEWETLHKIIAVREIAPHVALTVNRYLLENVRFANELFVSSNDEFKLHMGLVDITHGVYDGFFVGDCKVRVQRSKILVTTPKGRFSYKINEYKRFPYATLKKISENIFDYNS